MSKNAQRPIDYYFVECIDSSNTCGILSTGTIYSTRSNLDDYMYHIIENRNMWNSYRFRKIRVPSIDVIEALITTEALKEFKG
jgi:hypothetical protein